MNREFDVIVYGASGFTARHVIKNLIETNLKTALCGRSEQKIRKNIGFSPTASSLPIIECKVEDLAEVTRRGKVLINCAGPFVLCGEEVVRACVSSGTHYVDITGEPYFVEKIINKYHDEASEKNVFIVPCCGFDSVPADIGIMYLKSVLNCSPVWARSYLELHDTYINHTTYDTVIHSISHMNDLRNLRSKNASILTKEENHRDTSKGPKKENSDEVLKLRKSDKLKKIPFLNALTQTYCILFLGADAAVVKRSQSLMTHHNIGSSIQYRAYISLGKSFIFLCLFLLWLLLFFLTSQFECGRKFLMRYPEVFTFGLVRKTGPTERNMENAKFRILFEGLGIDLVDKSKKKHVTVSVSGPDPGYITTSACVTVCATLLLDLVEGKWQSAIKGGILTPSTAFYGTDIVERLMKKGINFKVEGENYL